MCMHATRRFLVTSFSSYLDSSDFHSAVRCTVLLTYTLHISDKSQSRQSVASELNFPTRTITNSHECIAESRIKNHES